MNRKYFLSNMVGLLGLKELNAHPAAINALHAAAEDSAMRIPAYLQQGDKIGISSPAGYITKEDIQPAVEQLTNWGLVPVIGSTIGKRDFTFGGTDEERRIDFQQMLDDHSIKAILCARGGYGIVRIIDQLDFSEFRKNPKWIIGFSDVTVLHSHIHAHCNIATIHSKMCNSFPAEPGTAEPDQKKSIESIRQCLFNEKFDYEIPVSSFNRTGIATAQLIGGNLKTIESLSGTPSDISTRNKILFVEDTGEYLYSIDRMFWNLKRTGKLDQLKGLIICGFKVKKDDEGEEFGKSLEQIVLEKLSDFKYPVCFGFPVGHQKLNMAIACGRVHRLEVSAGNVSLTPQ
jgi:muramoyltetrapeptide carboxypeptidase